MNQSLRVLSVAVATLFAVGQIPALAQYANEFVPAKLIKEGKTSTTIAGSGKVVVQVQVNADGSHKVTKIISSTNSGDNAAATEIANSSTYRPARRGTTPITAFYDFTLRFNGRTVVQSSSGSSGVSLSGASLTPAASQVAALIRAGQYAQAKSKAQMELLNSPGDDSLREMLGVASYDAGDFTAASAAFDKVPTIGAQFRSAAAQSFAAAAVKGATDNPEQSLAYAQKAVALAPDTNSRFALGVAQLANNDSAAALASLKAAHDTAMADSKIPLASKVNIDAELLQAYLANNDVQDAQAIAAQIKQLDPSSTAGARAMGASLLKSGQAAAVAKDTATALRDYDQAAAVGDPTVAVTANVLAAFAIAQGPKPDYKRMQSYADKAIALQPDNPQANFAEGIALTAQWSSSHDDGTKKRATDALAKADQLAKAQGNEALSLQIETFVKQNLNPAPSAPSGGGL
ncbi:MAG TPA: energy transducer TonB [Candidatus Acidoferrum sp.]|jgi:tetratricopeptide (TPR) repeat protein|nr:energy transducer TonB [Candidatus Acidoferrum sp.]